MKLHPAGPRSYVGIMHLDESTEVVPQNKQKPLRVVILDNSGSMGQWSQRMCHVVLPDVLSRVGAAPDEDLLLLLFSNSTTRHRMKVKDLGTFKLPSQGATRMSGVFPSLQAAVTPEISCLQILALSDGEVHDKSEVAASAGDVAQAMKAAGNCSIQARAIRLLTSKHANPDTSALASILQFNTEGGADLVTLRPDISMGAMAVEIAQMFSEVTTEFYVAECPSGGMSLQPWEAPQESLRLRRGKNTLWFEDRPTSLQLDGKAVQISEGPALTQASMETILNDRLDFFVNQIKVLKVIDTQSAKENISRIVEFFRSFEASLQPDAEMGALLEGHDLKSRCLYTRKAVKSRLRSITTVMENIANDDRVRNLNEAQKADYLRQMGTNKNARALAKRAQTSGMDFDSTLRKEILAMKANLAELDGVNTLDHAVSFYSQANTMEGILAVCEVADDEELFESMLAVDLLRLFNVVGVPAVGPVAEYPDPMTYRLDKLMAGNFVSVADVSVVELQGATLKMPGSNIKINNAVPYFEDVRIQRFLMHYAPTSLEYMCSIGMRRVLAEVPLTFPYTLCAGVWRLIQQLDNDKSELNINLLQRMAPSYHKACKHRFDYVVPLCQKDSDPEKSYFLSYNGATNMIAPLWGLVGTGDLQNMPRILRALYSFETFQVMRRFCRQKDTKFYQQQVDRLLGVDFQARGTPLPAMYTRPEVQHAQGAVVDKTLFEELREAISFVKYITIIVPMFLAVRSENPIAAVRAVPEISDETLTSALGLDYPVEEFLLYNLVEGYLYQTKTSRTDKDTTKMLRPDLGVRKEGQDMVRQYLLERYSEDYDLRLKQMAGEEKKILMDEHIKSLVETDSVEEFSKMLSEGVRREAVTFKIANFNSQGCLELHAALMDTKIDVKKRAEKLYIFYTGEELHNQEKLVWNGGNGYRTSMEPLRKLLESLNETAMWARIQERFKSKISHVYNREARNFNRHGHNNDKPSYYAFGHDLLESFVCVATESAWLEYQNIHRHCCGVRNAVADPESFKEAVKRWTARRERRQECEADKCKVEAAIERKKARRAQKKLNKLQAPPRGLAARKRQRPQSSDGSDSDDASQQSF